MIGAFEVEPGSVSGVKICGIRSAGDARMVVDSGADALGVNLFPGSKRFVELGQATAWLRDLEGEIARVAVVVNLSADEVRRAWASGVLDAVQLHGDEDEAFCAPLLDEGIELVRAYRVRGEETLGDVGASAVRYALLDAYRKGEYGGTGEVFDWDLAKRLIETEPDKRVVLAGGLTAENVAAAVAATGAAAVDVAGGVESAPAVKDAGLVREFVARAKSVGRV